MADLITLEEYKDFKGKSKTDEDSKISFIISGVSSLIKTYCGHTIVDNYTDPIVEDVVSVFPSQTIYLTATPVKDIISVEELPGPTGTYLGGLDSTISYPVQFGIGYALSTYSGGLVRIGGDWAKTVRVTYTAGYAEVPIDLKLATIELVSYYLNEEWKPTRQMQGTTMNTAVNDGDFPPHILRILDNYKVT